MKKSEREFSAEDLREWRNDPKGRPFWDEIVGLKQYHVSLERAYVREGKLTEANFAEGYAYAMEEMMTLVDKIIDENKREENA